MLTFCIVNWYTNVTEGDKKKLNKIVKSAKRIGCDVVDLEVLFKEAASVKMKKIVKDDLHPLNQHFNLLPSGIRMRSIYSRTNRLRDSFVLSAIRLFNGKW